MFRQLLILRHAKSDWTSNARTDFERPLAKRGKKEAPRMGTWLRQQKLVPDYVVSSPARRAKQTTLKVYEALNIKDLQIHWDPRIYEATTEELLNVLADCPSHAKRVLLVGHNPGLESLLMYLCGSNITRPDDGKLLPTTALAYLKMPEVWADLSPCIAELISITRSRSLPQT